MLRLHLHKYVSYFSQMAPRWMQGQSLDSLPEPVNRMSLNCAASRRVEETEKVGFQKVLTVYGNIQWMGIVFTIHGTPNE